MSLNNKKYSFSSTQLLFPWVGVRSKRTNSDIRNFDTLNENHLGKENCQNSLDAKKYILLDLSERCIDVFNQNDQLSFLKKEKRTIGEYFNKVKEEKGQVIEGGFKFTLRYIEDEKKDKILVESSDPVIISFKTITINSKDYPNLKDQIKHIEELLKSHQASKEDLDGVEFYKNQLKILNSPEINVLRISDRNTTGVSFNPLADSELLADEPWLSIIQHSSISSKIGVSRRGSEGKGKFVNFSASNLSTVFYHSKFSECPKFSSNEKVNRIFGSRILIDDVTINKKNHSGQGYHCGDYIVKGENIRAPFPIDSNFPHWIEKDNSQLGFDSDKTGLDIFVMGFEPQKDNWELLVKNAIIEKYHIAIKNNEFEVEINDLYIDSNSIDNDLNDETYTKSNQALLDVKHLMQTHKSDEADETKINGFGSSDFKIKILLNNSTDKNDDLFELGDNKLIAWYRDGMLITKRNPFSETEKPGMMRFSGKDSVIGGFCAIISSDDDETNQILRSFENAKHDDFALNDIHVKRYQKKVDKLKAAVKKEIVRVAGINENNQTEEISIDHLNKKFKPDPSSQSSGITINGQGSLGVAPKPKDPKKPIWKEISSKVDAYTGDITVTEEDINKESKTFGKLRTRLIKVKIKLNKALEAFNKIKGSSDEVIFIYKVNESKKINISLETDPGDGTGEEIAIISAEHIGTRKQMKIYNGSFSYNFKKGQLVQFKIKIKTISGYSLSLIKLNADKINQISSNKLLGNDVIIGEDKDFHESNEKRFGED